jgi:uncharacterized protein
MIDVHCHLMPLQAVPDSFFAFFGLNRARIGSLHHFMSKLVPASSRGLVHRLGEIMRLGALGSKDILARLEPCYPPDTVFAPLMMDFEQVVKDPPRVRYEQQLEELVQLQSERPDRIFPFLAVDPRRVGIEELVERWVGHDKPFRGIKVYPPFGYLPGHPVLMEIFGMCQARGIPVTTHCAPRTMPIPSDGSWTVTGRAWQDGRALSIDETLHFRNSNKACEFFCNPAHWIPVLESYPALRVNLGHLGGDDILKGGEGRSVGWPAKVLELMAAYPNVYSDISWIFAYQSIHGAFKSLLSSDIGHKLMFGTDAFLVLVVGLLDVLLERYIASLSAEEWNKLSWTNPARFLGLGDR